MDRPKISRPASFSFLSCFSPFLLIHHSMPIPNKPADRLIFALDVPDKEQALSYVKQLDGIVTFFKVGWELFLAEGLSMVR
ncbi:MAG: orotidine 5'-phosphate decarboxylase / HUMPS family protein, partial [Nitrospirota bacterium]|nr:orotidine 5'-phosphate decarboxylase / HUMPS family protein [Nitrospirota bacterium]